MDPAQARSSHPRNHHRLRRISLQRSDSNPLPLLLERILRLVRRSQQSHPHAPTLRRSESPTLGRSNTPTLPLLHDQIPRAALDYVGGDRLHPLPPPPPVPSLAAFHHRRTLAWHGLSRRHA